MHSYSLSTQLPLGHKYSSGDEHVLRVGHLLWVVTLDKSQQYIDVLSLLSALLVVNVSSKVHFVPYSIHVAPHDTYPKGHVIILFAHIDISYLHEPSSHVTSPYSLQLTYITLFVLLQ